MTDHQRFSTSAEFMRWVERIVKNGDQRYDRVPVGRQTWTYGDGHIEESEWGKRGGHGSFEPQDHAPRAS
jgi:hypothetical protein